MSIGANRDRLRIAIQKSGRLTEPSLDLLRRCGLSFRTSRDKLFCYGETMPVDLLLVRDDDIPGLIAQGVCELGVIGRNLLLELSAQAAGRGTRAEIVELRALGFGACRLSLAVPEDWDWQGPAQLAGSRIATSYPGLLGQWLSAQGVDATPVVLNGAVEIAPKLGTADCICDLVSSGATLAANQLREVAVLMESQSVLVGGPEAPRDERGEWQDLLLRRLDGVLQVRDSRLLLFAASRDDLPGLLPLIPRGATPRVLADLNDPQQVAVQALCHEAVDWRHLEALKRQGASQLLVLPVETMLS